jgi:hypothetical protein
MPEDMQQQAAPEPIVDVEKPQPVIIGEAPPAPEDQEQQANADTDAEAKGDASRDEKGRFKPGVQQRIDEITRQRHEAEREAAYWRQRATAGTDQQAQNTAQPQAKPTADQFQDYAEYVEALTEWKADQKVSQAFSARDAEKAQEADSKVQQTRAEAWTERQQQARTAMPDYDEVVGLSDLPIAPHIGDVLLDSENGPQLAYHLAKNPDLAAHLNTLSPLAAARELGRIEASLDKPATPAAKTVSNAPAPIKPIGSGRTSAADNLAGADMEQYRAIRAKQGARWANR